MQAEQPAAAGPIVEQGVGRPAPEGDLYEPYRSTMRMQHGYCGPYRLGIAVGQAGADLPGPYAAGTRGEKNYLEGVRYGRELALGSPAEREYQSGIDALKPHNAGIEPRPSGVGLE